MKNKNFFYLQYNKLKWENQEKTKLNSFVNDYIIKNIILKKKNNNIRIFDIGFGIGVFLKKLIKILPKSYKSIMLEGCEPSIKNYNNFKLKPTNSKKVKVKIFNETFSKMETNVKFDFITSIYVFPHIESDELDDTAKKIYSMLEYGGKFILVVANQKYIEEKLKTKRDLFIEKNIIKVGEKRYKEILHYSEIPQIGTIIDYNRDEKYYIDLFKKIGFDLSEKKNLNDNGFICTIFVFSKEKMKN